jgi:hypothetical protein
MQLVLAFHLCFLLGISKASTHPAETKKSVTSVATAVDKKPASSVTVPFSVESKPVLADKVFIKNIPLILDGTEYAASEEHFNPQGVRTKHFLRQSEAPHTIESERKSVQSTLDVDETFASDVEEGLDYIVSAIETIPAVETVDTWAQETRAGFMGYIEKVAGLWKKESKSVGNKLFEAADGYSHRFFNLLHVKESDHPVLAAKMTRIILAMTLSLALVFVIFGLALHLQRSIVAKAHEDASKQQPRLPSQANGGEQLFFAMPYPHIREDGNIVIVE